MTRRLPVPSLLALLALAPAPAAATGLSLGTELSFVRDGSYDAFDAEDDLFGRLDVALAYTVFAADWIHLEAELAYGYAGSYGASVAAWGMSTGFSSHDALAGFRAVVVPPGFDWIRPFVRLQGGAAFGWTSLSDGSAPAMEDDAVGGSAFAGAGVEILLPSAVFLDDPDDVVTEPFAFGLFFEGGYRYRSPLDFHPVPPTPDDDAVAADRIPVAGIDLGSVDLSGGTFRAGLIVRI